MKHKFRKDNFFSMMILIVFLGVSSYSTFFWNTLWIDYWKMRSMLSVLFVLTVLSYTILLAVSSFRHTSVQEEQTFFRPFFLLCILCIGMSTAFSEEFFSGLPNLAPVQKAQLKDVVLIVLKTAGLYSIMVAGMISKWLWDTIEAYKRGVKLKLDYLKLAKPLLVSPIVFLFFWAIVQDQPFGLLHYLLAYQNGFFWQSILYPKK